MRVATSVLVAMLGCAAPAPRWTPPPVPTTSTTSTTLPHFDADNRWMPLSRTEGATVYIDLTALHRDKRGATVWERAQNDDGTYGLYHYAIDCRGSRMRLDQYTAYDASDRPRGWYRYNELQTPLEAPVPGSVDESIMQAVCGHR